MGHVHIGEGFQFPEDFWTSEFQDLFPQSLLKVREPIGRDGGTSR
jgi:hypothetical protein